MPRIGALPMLDVAVGRGRAGPGAGADTTKLAASPEGRPAIAGSSIVVRIDDAARKARHPASFRFAD
ncbi:TPA: hypothetical protein ACUNF5_000486 [Burkholderia orbicola]|uniref:hypothetical protein n=1 Tax=Burkholderia cenocepacia TaxID=95486 RepID=UPI000F5A27A7|nr:hypothetical protein [Burkholderia cenocepacia]RQV28023.1 hypothetical protein DF030_05345 [Burkholderia cenocepacia]